MESSSYELHVKLTQHYQELSASEFLEESGIHEAVEYILHTMLKSGVANEYKSGLITRKELYLRAAQIVDDFAGEGDDDDDDEDDMNRNVKTQQEQLLLT